MQAANGNWFYGAFMSACIGLDTADKVGFVTDPSGDFDRWSRILVRPEFPCYLARFAQSEAPPDRRRGTTAPLAVTPQSAGGSTAG